MKKAFLLGAIFLFAMFGVIYFFPMSGTHSVRNEKWIKSRKMKTTQEVQHRLNAAASSCLSDCEKC